MTEKPQISVYVRLSVVEFSRSAFADALTYPAVTDTYRNTVHHYGLKTYHCNDKKELRGEEITRPKPHQVSDQI